MVKHDLTWYTFNGVVTECAEEFDRKFFDKDDGWCVYGWAAGNKGILISYDEKNIEFPDMIANELRRLGFDITVRTEEMES